MLAEEHEAAIASGREALVIAEPLGLGEIVAATLGTVGLARSYAGDAGGRDDVERSLQTALAIHSPEAARAYNNLAAIFFSGGDLRRARTVAEEGIRVAERFGNAPIMQNLGSWEADWTYADGRWDDCLRTTSDFIAACEAGSPNYLESWIRMVRGHVRLARRDDEGALDDGRRAIAAGRVANEPVSLSDALGFLLRAEVELGRTADAQETAEELLSYLTRGVGGTCMAPLRLAWAAASLGLAAEARGALNALPPYGRWLESARLVLDGRYGHAADLFVEIGSLPEEAYARIRAAERLTGEGRSQEADAQLQPALAFWRSVGATRYIREAEAILEASDSLKQPR
jgi:tetratricopeptide (TPR) repeat protein